jgi:hypothetical protein
MASNGLVNKTSFTIRQQEIVAKAAKVLGIPYDNVTSALVVNDIPENISVSTDSKNYSRLITPIYGEILNETEISQLIAERLQAADSQLESLNGVASLLGKNKQPAVSSAGTDRIRAESIANPTFDPSVARRTNAGLPNGAQNAVGTSDSPIVKFTAPKGDDTRVRIVVPSGPLNGILLSGPVLSLLRSTNGVLFPYTPSITITHGAQYNAENIVHTNYAYQFYQSSGVEDINISAVFSCKNSTDASYVVAAQHFFRTVTKMFYGQDAEAGLPPPVLRLEGHGDYQFGSHKQQVGGVPVVIRSFSVTLPDDVDYMTASTSPVSAGAFRIAEANSLTAGSLDSASSSQTRVPIIQTFTITCSPIYSRKSISQDFGFKNFASGQLLASSSRGGFI